MGYVAFSKLDNVQFSNLPKKIELTLAQKRAWNAEMKTRLFKHSHSFTKTMVIVDLTNESVGALTSAYRASRDDVAFVLTNACKKALACHKKLIVKAQSTSDETHAQARDAFMAGMGFSWNAKGQRYERNL